jgi:hypothetical protein
MNSRVTFTKHIRPPTSVSSPMSPKVVTIVDAVASLALSTSAQLSSAARNRSS